MLALLPESETEKRRENMAKFKDATKRLLEVKKEILKAKLEKAEKDLRGRPRGSKNMQSSPQSPPQSPSPPLTTESRTKMRGRPKGSKNKKPPKAKVRMGERSPSIAPCFLLLH